MGGSAGERRTAAAGYGAQEGDMRRELLSDMDRESHARLSDRCDQRRTRRKCKRRRQSHWRLATTTTALLASTIPTAMAQNCISLTDSTACPAFNASSISTNSNLTGLFPFLSTVTDTASFDSGLREYIANGFTQARYTMAQRLAW